MRTGANRTYTRQPISTQAHSSRLVRKRRLSPDQYLGSVQLKEWVRKNKDQEYVPVDLLKAWDFEGCERLLKVLS